MRDQRGRIWLFASVVVATGLTLCCVLPVVVVLNLDYFFATAIRMLVEASHDDEPVTGTPGEELRRLDGHRGIVYCVAYSPDGRRILSASGTGGVDRGGWDCSVRLWDAATGDEIRRMTGHRWWVYCVAFSPDGRKAASGAGAHDRTVRLWDLDTGKQLFSLKGHTDAVNSVAFSPDGQFLVSAGKDRNLIIWDPETGREVRRIRGSDDGILSVAVSPDSRQILSGGWDGTIRVWDVETGEEVAQFEGQEGGVYVHSVAFSPDGTMIACGGGGWKPLPGSNRYEMIGKTIRLWDLRDKKLVKEFRGHEQPIHGIAFSPDGRRIVSCGGYYNLDEGVDCTVRLWDVASGKELRCFKGHTKVVSSVAVSPDGKYAVSGGTDYSIRIWCLDENLAAPQGDRKMVAGPKNDKPWEIAEAGTASVAIPKGWREIRPRQRQMLLYRQGDGLGVPALDETKSPLQIGMTVERFPRTKESLKEGIEGLAKEAKKNPRLALVGKESIESLKLSDESDAMLLTTEFVMDRDRRSLQMKMLVKDKDSNGWVISGFLVAGKDSKIPRPGSDIAKWLRAHVTSFCLDGKKLDETKLTEANKGREGKQ